MPWNKRIEPTAQAPSGCEERIMFRVAPRLMRTTFDVIEGNVYPQFSDIALVAVAGASLAAAFFEWRDVGRVAQGKRRLHSLIAVGAELLWGVYLLSVVWGSLAASAVR